MVKMMQIFLIPLHKPDPEEQDFHLHIDKSTSILDFSSDSSLRCRQRLSPQTPFNVSPSRFSRIVRDLITREKLQV
jgi:hypothetical protein